MEAELIPFASSDAQEQLIRRHIETLKYTFGFEDEDYMYVTHVEKNANGILADRITRIVDDCVFNTYHVCDSDMYHGQRRFGEGHGITTHHSNKKTMIETMKIVLRENQMVFNKQGVSVGLQATKPSYGQFPTLFEYNKNLLATQLKRTQYHPGKPSFNNPDPPMTIHGKDTGESDDLAFACYFGVWCQRRYKTIKGYGNDHFPVEKLTNIVYCLEILNIQTFNEDES